MRNEFINCALNTNSCQLCCVSEWGVAYDLYISSALNLRLNICCCTYIYIYAMGNKYKLVNIFRYWLLSASKTV